MKQKFNNRIKLLAMPILIMLTFLLTLNGYKVKANSEYTVNININILSDHKTDYDELSKREVLVWKVSNDHLEANKILTSKKFDSMTEDEVSQILGNPLLKKESQSISDDKEFELITFNLEKGIYLIKESDASLAKLEKEIEKNQNTKSKKLVTTVIQLPEDISNDTNILDINIKTEAELENPEDIVLIKKDYHNGKKIDKVGFKLFKREYTSRAKNEYVDKLVPVKGESGKYIFNSFKNIDENEIPILYTNTDGRIEVKDLPEGEYFFKEVEPQKQYQNSANIGKVTDILKPGDTFELDNEREPGLEKKDSDTGKALDGVAFEVYDKANNRLSFTKDEFGEYTFSKEGGEPAVYTSNKGTIFIKDLPEAKDYYFVEVSTLDGYIKTDEKFYFDVDENGNILGKNGPIIVYNKPIVPSGKNHGDRTFVKVSSEKSNDRLAGAKFVVQIKTANGYQDVIKDGKSYVVISDEKGEFTVKDLEEGVYYLREIKAPKGYLKLDRPIRFEISSSSAEERPIFIENMKIPKRPPLPKTGDTKILVFLALGFIMVLSGFKMISIADKKEK